MDRQQTADWRRIDPEGLQDFIDALRDYVPAIERDVAHLRVASADREALGSLFRSLHNVKGDAALLAGSTWQLPWLTRSRPCSRGCVATRSTNRLAELVLLLVDRLELAMTRLAAGRAVADLQVEPMVEGIEDLAQLAPSQLDEGMAAVIEMLTGCRPLASSGFTVAGESNAPPAAAPLRPRDDLAFFQLLACELDGRSPRFAGRTERLVRMAPGNESGGR